MSNKEHLPAEAEPEVRRLYVENDYPVERIVVDAAVLDAFTAELNRRLKRADDPKFVAAELFDIRKSKRLRGGLPRIGRAFRGPKFR